MVRWLWLAVPMYGCLQPNGAWDEEPESGAPSSGQTTTTSAEASSSGGSTGEAPTYAERVLEAGPLAYWRLEEAVGPQARDEMGAYPGTYGGSPAYAQPGLVAGSDGAVAFGADGATVSMGDVLDFGGLSSFSLELWFRSEAVDTTWPHLFTKATSETGCTLKLSPEQTADFSCMADPWTKVFAAYPLGVPVHLVITYDQATMRMFVDGQEQDAQPLAGGVFASTGSLTLATDSVLPGQAGELSFDGVLDEVAIYPIALPAAEIRAHADLGRQGP